MYSWPVEQCKAYTAITEFEAENMFDGINISMNVACISHGVYVFLFSHC